MLNNIYLNDALMIFLLFQSTSSSDTEMDSSVESDHDSSVGSADDSDNISAVISERSSPIEAHKNSPAEATFYPSIEEASTSNLRGAESVVSYLCISL